MWRVLIREARDEDWPAIYEFFAAIVDAGETYSCPLGLSSERARAVWLEPAPSRTFVAVEGESVLGSAKTGPNRPGRGSHIATAAFMVSPAAQGRGVGRALGEYVVDWARAQGFRGMQFNAVVETNTGAVALWRSLGFEVIGTVPGAFRHPREGYVGLHVMYREL
jgi:GNAT superfamily N-acetyltransferase